MRHSSWSRRPETTIDSGPSGIIASSSASVAFSAVASVQIGNDTAGQAGTVYADNITVTS